MLVARDKGRVAGYGALVWDSGYEPFREEGIPEIMDLNVIDEHQRQGLGAALVHLCEEIARKQGTTRTGISVVQSEAYAAANRLYPKLGYVPDGRGITEHDNELHMARVLV